MTSSLDIPLSSDEYLPPADPPPVSISESMRRLRDLNLADKLSANDLHFQYNTRLFHATILESGAISARAPRTSDPNLGPDRLSDTVHKVYSSPSEFCQDMASVAVSAQKQKPRGKISVNGWEQCFVHGRSLASLRNEMLREKKPPVQTPPSVPPSAPPSAPPLAPHSVPPSAPSDPVPSTEPIAKQEEMRQVKDKADEAKEPETAVAPKALEGSAQPATAREKDVENAVEGAPPQQKHPSEKPLPKAEDTAQSSPEYEQKQPKPEGETKVTPDEGIALAEKATNPTSVPSETAPSRDKAPTEMKHSKESSSGNETKPSGPEQVAKDNAQKEEPSPTAESSKDEVTEKKTSGVEGDKEVDSQQPEVAETYGKLPPSPNIDLSNPPPPHPTRKKSPNIIQEEANSPSPEPARSEKSRGEKRKPESPEKQETKRRRRNDANESLGSEANTPQRKSQERTSKPRADGSRSGRKHDIPSLTEMDTEGLDPEAIEAAAIAAQADKEEANSRARRTTRLATGKIKHVDYKASANAQGPRSVSPANDEDDGDNSQTNDSAMETTRASRRRAAQTPAPAPQRTSRRVAKLRSSQEKDQSSNDDLNIPGGRHLSPGKGSDGRNEYTATRSDEMKIDPVPSSRMNGAKGEGRERKRARLDSVSRRTRQSSQELADAEGEGKFGTRSSTRENSIEKEDNADDTGNDDDLDMEDDEDPDRRTDEFGWTSQDLTQIGDAMDIQDTTEPDAIVRELHQSGNWNADDATNKRLSKLINKAQSSISELKKSVLPNNKGEVSVKDIRAYLANKVWRLKHGGLRTTYPRKPTGVLARIEKEEQEKISADRQRRKLQREADEQRDKLDSEMEAWRKAQFELSYAEIAKRNANRMVEREACRIARLERDIERYKTKEAKVRVRLDRTKLIVSQKREEKDTPDDGNDAFQNQAPNSPVEKTEQCENGAKSEIKVSRESVTSEDDVDMTRKECLNSDELRREIDRYRELLAVKSAESEGFQRACERERMEYVMLLESKGRLEAELYLSKSSSYANAASAVNTASPAPASKKAGPDVRRSEHRNGSGNNHRSNANSRGKGANGKNNGGPSASAAATNNGGPSKPKNSGGKNGESSKGVKRKTAGKGHANGTEK